MCVSVITVNYNTSAKTIELIESLNRFVDLAYEVIVVDNFSDPVDFQ